jgi:molybdopterin molybdotransferase
LTPQNAEQAIRERVTPLPAEPCALQRCAGRVLRQDVIAERDSPPFDRVCMDGVALASGALASGADRFVVQALQPAGVPALRLADETQAIEVMTGAVLPTGTDCVIPLEEYRTDGPAIVLERPAATTAGRNVQHRGSDARGGTLLLRAGTRLGAAEVAIVASAGLAQVQVSRQPRVMVVSTGDELIEAGQPIAPHQVRRSNAHAIVATLRLAGLAEVGDDHITDDEALLQRRLAAHLAGHDLLVLTGGVSKGRFDFVPDVLRRCGVEQVFHHVDQKPGRPLWFGITPDGKPVFGLPGNPVSTLVCLRRYVQPALALLGGTTPQGPEPVALATPVTGSPRQTTFIPADLRADDGPPRAWPRAHRGSGDFLSLAGTAGFIELPPMAAARAASTIVDLWRW